MDYVSLHDIDFKQSLRCTCIENDGVPARICADGIMLGFKEEQVMNLYCAYGIIL